MRSILVCLLLVLLSASAFCADGSGVLGGKLVDGAGVPAGRVLKLPGTLNARGPRPLVIGLPPTAPGEPTPGSLPYHRWDPPLEQTANDLTVKLHELQRVPVLRLVGLRTDLREPRTFNTRPRMFPGV